MWNLTEESGNIAWGAPEAMGEILARHEQLAKEFSHILVSYIREDGNFLEHEPLQHGVVWGLGRLAEVRPERLLEHEAADHLAARLQSGDARVRALVARVLGLLRAERYRSALLDLCEDETEASLYNGRTEIRCRVGDVAREAITMLDSEGQPRPPIISDTEFPRRPSGSGRSTRC
jgi:HEAT repeat protein